MLELTPEQAAEAASMTPAEWSAHIARYQPPDTAEQLRTAAAQHVPADQLDQVMGIVDPSKFVGSDGQIDQARVSEHFGRWFGPSDVQQSQPNWGQGSYPGGPTSTPGDRGRAEAAKRFGANPDPMQAATAPTRRGAAGSAEAAKRFGGTRK